ncbi:MAG: response regulator transcription factor [Chloroflexi bacterium]|nr:response regulator transcription factor [Chloroflexota bacterium]
MKVLIVDDEPDIIEVLEVCFQLRWPGTTIVAADDGEGGIRLADLEQPDLIILDVGLPDMDGFEVCQALRRFTQVPVIMLTARGEGIDKVKGLELGADDYVTKPFDHLELLARAQAVLRRIQRADQPSRPRSIVVGPVSLDPGSREVRVDGRLVRLTPTEYNLLYHLARHAGQILPHRTLLAKVWGREYVDEVDYLKVHIQHLRQKLGDDSQAPRLILTERGVGYRLAVPPEME